MQGCIGGVNRFLSATRYHSLKELMPRDFSPLPWQKCPDRKQIHPHFLTS